MKNIYSLLAVSVFSTVVITYSTCVQALPSGFCTEANNCTIRNISDGQYITASWQDPYPEPRLSRNSYISIPESAFFFVKKPTEEFYTIYQYRIFASLVMSVAKVEKRESVRLRYPTDFLGEHWKLERVSQKEIPGIYLLYLETPSGEKLYLSSDLDQMHYVITKIMSTKHIKDYLFTITLI